MTPQVRHGIRTRAFLAAAEPELAPRAPIPRVVLETLREAGLDCDEQLSVPEAWSMLGLHGAPPRDEASAIGRLLVEASQRVVDRPSPTTHRRAEPPPDRRPEPSPPPTRAATSVAAGVSAPVTDPAPRTAAAPQVRPVEVSSETASPGPFRDVTVRAEAGQGLWVRRASPDGFSWTTSWVAAEEYIAATTRQATTTVAPVRRRISAATHVAVFSWIRNVGLILVLFVAWQLWGTGLSEHRAQAALGREFTHELRTTPSTAPPSTPSRRTTTASAPHALLKLGVSPVPSPGTVVAMIRIPAISLSQFVVQGTEENNLAQGPGHYVETSMPGYAGNVAIAGHRTTYGAPFNRLGEVARGDTIDLTTTSGTVLHYVVTEGPTAVAPTDVAILRDFGDNRLTLTTCTPEFSAAQRLVVVAALVVPHGDVALAAPAATTAKSGIPLWRTSDRRAPVKPSKTPASTASRPSAATPSPDNWNLRNLPVAFGLGLVLVALGLAYRRVRPRLGWSTIMLAAPFWVVGLYLFFESLTALVPATL